MKRTLEVGELIAKGDMVVYDNNQQPINESRIGKPFKQGELPIVREELEVGKKVSWIRKGKVARIEGQTGKRVTGTITSLNSTLGCISIKPDFKTMVDGCVVYGFDNVRLI